MDNRATMSLMPVAVWIFCAFGQINAGMSNCLDGCQCEKDKMACTWTQIPAEPHENVTQLFITGFNFDTLTQETFSGPRWKHMKVLDIYGIDGEFLDSMCFVGLDNLEHLGLHGEMLMEMSDYTFRGLDNLQTLDLSNNFQLHTYQVTKALYSLGQPVLASLKNLTMAKLYSLRVESMNLDHWFISGISHNRRIEYIDLSYTNINILDFSSLRLLCNSLKHFKAQKMTLLFPKDFQIAPACTSLHTLDLTDIKLPITLNSLTFENTYISCQTMTFYNYVENLYISGTLSTPTAINHYHLNLTTCNFSMKTIAGRRNNIQFINMTVTLSDSLTRAMTHLDLSENILEYVSPSSLLPSKNLQILNLSTNRLYMMQTNYLEDFTRLLHTLKNLQQVYLAENKLTEIPVQFFTHNKLLVYIDLSKNKLTTISFEIKSLEKLKYLDLRNNAISILDLNIRLSLDTLHVHELQIGGSSYINGTDENQTRTDQISTDNKSDDNAFKINLASNSFICTCQDKHINFLKWIKTSACVDRQNTSRQFQCKLNGETLDIQTTALDKLSDYCSYQQLLVQLKIGIPITVVVLLVAVVIAIIARYKLRQREQYKHILQQLQNNKFPKRFLVYLSYCSEDIDFTLTNIYPQLNQTLSQLIGRNDRKYVCIGDRNFRAGHYIPNEVKHVIEDSATVMFVVSNRFCTKNFCQMEVNESCTQQKPVLLLMKEFVDIKNMPETLQGNFKHYTHASWINDDNGGHVEPDIQTLAESIIRLAAVNPPPNLLGMINCLRH